jgi:Tol biopolymer transport system component
VERKVRADFNGRGPFFSPDGRWIGFWQDGQLKKVAVTGGAPVALTKADNPTGASWGSDDVIMYGQGSNGIWQVAASGGQPVQLVKLDAAEVAHGPQMLPDRRAVLFTVRGRTDTNWNGGRIVVQMLDTGERRVVVGGGTDGRYLPSGRLLYSREDVLFAAPFDVDDMTVPRGPVPVLEEVRSGVVTGGVGVGLAGAAGASHFSVSETGLLAYVPGGGASVERVLVWVNRQGREDVVSGAPRRAYVYPRISPEVSRVAIDIRDQERDIWVWDLDRSTLTRITVDPAFDIDPLWTPDGKRLVFASNRAGEFNLFWQAADGTGIAEQLWKTDDFQSAAGFSPDGLQLLFDSQRRGGNRDIGVLNLNGDRQERLLTNTATFSEQNGTISPDGTWVAYQSNDSGRNEVYLSAYPNMETARHLVSTGGGTRPVWARSGRELVYLTEDGMMMAVDIETRPVLKIGSPTQLFQGAYFRGLTGRTFDVSADGQRSLMIKEAVPSAEAAPRIIIVENWLDELKRLVPLPRLVKSSAAS